MLLLLVGLETKKTRKANEDIVVPTWKPCTLFIPVRRIDVFLSDPNVSISSVIPHTHTQQSQETCGVM